MQMWTKKQNQKTYLPFTVIWPKLQDFNGDAYKE